MIETLLDAHCELGENPLWQAENGCLYWTDITAGKLHRLHLASSDHAIIYQGDPVGGFTRQADGTLLLFRVNDIAVLHQDGQVQTLIPFADEGSTRFNDVIADPEGRVFAGTIGKSDTSGGLFRIDRDGTLTLLFRGTGVSNGMGFSADLSTFYWTCSTRRQIYAFPYHRHDGSLGEPHLLYQASEKEGIPDGMAVDVEGNLWSARWDGYAIRKHAPDGTVLDHIPFPVAKISSLCFGGPERNEILVTTAGGTPQGESEDGAIYRYRSGVKGAEKYPSKILIQ